jgi:UDP-N-acetylmuramoylalanine--D-glutamate ligase
VSGVLVYGLAIAGEAVAHALHRRQATFTLVDDRPGEATRHMAAAVEAELVEAPSPATIEALVRSSDMIVPAPGVPETHIVFELARRHDVDVCSEVELAYRWEQQRPGGPRPILAITGTDGKTTTTELATAIVNATGRRGAAVGNTDTPLISALEDDLDVFVVEASSFRLAHTRHFRAEGSAWLNLAEDHQNWHTSMESYAAAKARLWQALRPDDVAVGAAHDPVVRSYLDTVAARRVTVALDDADYHVTGGYLKGPHGRILAVSDLARSLPHDLTNGLTAAALTLETGLASVDDVGGVLASLRPPRHRIEPAGHLRDVAWYNDSKATTPHAALTAVRSFASVVWIVGGRNKGLDLSGLVSEVDRVRAVVAMGEAASEIAALFEGRCRVRQVSTMAQAVEAAAALARPGDSVVLSPACASYDAYRNYGERGDDFMRCVDELRGVAR